VIAGTTADCRYVLLFTPRASVTTDIFDDPKGVGLSRRDLIQTFAPFDLNVSLDS
jgi:hypothetical protein